MAKLKAQDIKEHGWKASQFGQSPDWDAPAGVLDRLLDRSGRAVEARIGATEYAAAATGTLQDDQIRDAELALVEARLWRIRAAQFDSDASSSLDEAAYLNRREYLASAAAAEERYEMAIALIVTGVEAVGSDIAIGSLETGRFTPVGAS